MIQYLNVWRPGASPDATSLWNCFASGRVYSGMRYNRDEDLDDPIAFGRSIIVGAAAGLIACYAFVYMNGPNLRTGSILIGGEPQASPVRQLNSSPSPSSYQSERRAPDAEEPLDANETQSPPAIEPDSGIDKADGAGEEPDR
ncbi:MAG: hypothetical protein HOP13_05885 [Alphaproteobacteria bacterium]|nr:hypothetical protein [Alphaproteobacteria bacterium]